MKQIFILLFLTFSSVMMYSRDYLSDADFNYSTSAAYINDTFVKNFIGFSVKSGAGYKYDIKKVNLSEPLIINGVTYIGKVIVETDMPIEFVSLEDIRKQYLPDVSGKVIYMINNRFVFNDEKSYKLEKDFLERCELLQSSDFEIFKDNKDKFSIIKIFTKTFKIPVRIRKPIELEQHRIIYMNK